MGRRRGQPGPIDAEVRPLIKHAAEHPGQWHTFAILRDDEMWSTVRWFVNSRYSPFGWSPDGKSTTATHSFDLQWLTPVGHWTRDSRSPAVHRDGLRVGRVKILIKRGPRGEKARECAPGDGPDREMGMHDRAPGDRDRHDHAA